MSKQTQAAQDLEVIVDDASQISAGTWAIDPSHSTVSFVARHLMVAKVRGHFNDFSGKIQVAEPIETSRIDVSIEAASVDTREPRRDEHLRSPDFFEVDRFPTINFVSTNLEKQSDSNGRMTGDLTIKDTTRAVTLDVAFLGLATDPWGGNRAVFSASTQINREDFGLTWNQALETGGVLVSKDIKIELELTAVKQ